jgi:uncharacterized metal-binding protein
MMGDIYLSLCRFFIQLDLLDNQHKPGLISSCTTTRHYMHVTSQEEIEYMHRGEFTMLGVAFTSHTMFPTRIFCISKQIEMFHYCFKCVAFQHSYQHV